MATPNFVGKPLIDVEVSIERAFMGGTSPEFAMKYLMDGGLAPEVAQGIVKRMWEKAEAEKAFRLEQATRESRGAQRVGRFLSLAGFAMIALSILAVKYLAWDFASGGVLLGLLIAYRGIRMIISGRDMRSKRM